MFLCALIYYLPSLPGFPGQGWGFNSLPMASRVGYLLTPSKHLEVLQGGPGLSSGLIMCFSHTEFLTLTVIF
jgi:hypothetical protein